MSKLFIQRLKELRAEKMLSQRAIARELGISQTAYFKWESGESEPGIDSIHVLCTVFDVSADYLLGFENEDGTKINYTT